jgi:ubiquinone/menaquinone biosynthesis C-methylase UbiE
MCEEWSDRMVIELEIREIIRHLSDGDRVLDVGCANGYSTVQFACQKRVQVRGLDYIPEMVNQARLRAASMAHALVGRVEFDVGDATALTEPDEAYDKVVAIRVIINLGEWERQRRGLLECARAVRPGGRLLLSEATIQGWQRLNKLRRECRCSSIGWSACCRVRRFSPSRAARCSPPPSATGTSRTGRCTTTGSW